MRKTIFALTLATITLTFADYAVGALKSTMGAHVAKLDRVGSQR